MSAVLHFQHRLQEARSKSNTARQTALVDTPTRSGPRLLYGLAIGTTDPVSAALQKSHLILGVMSR